VPFFRKKPVVIEARQVNTKDDNDLREIVNWCGGYREIRLVDGSAISVYIDTMEGIMEAKDGDWIIKGIKGEPYPCKPDIFEATYEPVTK